MISAVDRAMEILETLSADMRGATVGELVDRLGIEKSVVSRVLSTLESQGYVTREPQSNLFRLGLRIVGLALRHLECVGLWELCMPILRRLSDSTGELTQLAIADETGLTYVAKAESEQRIRAVSVVGTRSVLHASTAGRVWLASLPEARVLELIGQAGLRKLTPNTIDSFERLNEELARVRTQGYSVIVEELLEGASGVGVPVRGPASDRVIGVLVLSGPAFRFRREQIDRALPDLIGAARELGRILPGAPPSQFHAIPDLPRAAGGRQGAN
jgi:DNA-binding IclR family transcriptional regulator